MSHVNKPNWQNQDLGRRELHRQNIALQNKLDELLGSLLITLHSTITAGRLLFLSQVVSKIPELLSYAQNTLKSSALQEYCLEMSKSLG